MTDQPTTPNTELREKLKPIIAAANRNENSSLGSLTLDEALDKAVRVFEAQLSEARLETAKGIRNIFDMSEFDPTGTMMDEHMFSRTPEEIAESKRYNFDHAWAALSAQGKIDEYIKAQLNPQKPGEEKQ